MRLLLAALATVVLAGLSMGCAGGTSTPTASPAMTVGLSARDSAFEPLAIRVAPGTPFAIDFTNYDSVPHNVTIQGTPTRLTGEIFTGPGERVYVFPALAAGDYRFICDVHPDMTGVLQVE